MQASPVQSCAQAASLAVCRLVNDFYDLQCELAEFTGDEVLLGQDHRYSVEHRGKSVDVPVAIDPAQVTIPPPPPCLRPPASPPLPPSPSLAFLSQLPSKA